MSTLNDRLELERELRAVRSLLRDIREHNPRRMQPIWPVPRTIAVHIIRHLQLCKRNGDTNAAELLETIHEWRTRAARLRAADRRRSGM